MPRGGKRQGAGRKPGPQTIEKEQIRLLVRETVAPAVVSMTQAQIAHAHGLKYLVAREKATGKFTKLTKEKAEAILSGEDTTHDCLEVWEKEPSVQAYTDLMNRAADKPIEPVEQHHSGSIKLTHELL